MIGAKVSHYEIREKLGAGGMGVVYKAWDTDLDRWVALKFLPQHADSDPVVRERFVREAKAASALEHPHICTIHEIGQTEDGQLFICMAYYAGPDLSQVIRSGQLTTARALEIARQLCSALGRAHEEGIVHRDLKPSNVMTTSQGDVAIVDFGLAKLAGQISITREGAAMGTTAYMSPEQMGGRELDSRTDLWSFGVILYQLLAGRHPFPGDYQRAIQLAVLEEDPDPPSSHNPEVSPHLDEVVLRLLAKDRSDRYSSAGEVSQLLQSSSGSSLDSQMPTEIVTPQAATASRQPEPGSKLRLWGVVAAGLAVAIAILAILWPPTKSDLGWVIDDVRGTLDEVQNPDRFDTAQAQLRDPLDRHPDSPSLHALLSEALVGASGVHADSSLLIDAEAAAARAVDLDPDLPEARIAQARVFRETNRSEQALEILQQLVATHPDLDEAYMELGTCYRRIDDLRAEAAFRQAISIRPDRWMHWNNLGSLLLSDGDLDGAREAFRRAIELSPSTAAWAAENLASLETSVGNYSEALAAYDLLPRPITDALTASNIGTAHYYLEQFDEAETYYRLSVELQPTDAWLHANLADLLAKKGLDEQAAAEYRTAHDLVLERLLLDPRNISLKIDSALYLAKSGDCEHATRKTEELEDEKVTSAVQAHHIAQVFAVCGDQESALRLIEQAIDLGRPIQSIAVDSDFHSLEQSTEFQRLIGVSTP